MLLPEQTLLFLTMGNVNFTNCCLALRGTLLASRLASAAGLCVPASQALKFPKRVRVHDDRHNV